MESMDDESLLYLIGQRVGSVVEAYNLYKKYAFELGFSIRKHRSRSKKDELYMKQFVCWKQVEKDYKNKTENERIYSKLDFRTKCNALVEFRRIDDGIWEVQKYFRKHNHEMCFEHQRHLLRYSRNMNSLSVDYLKTLKDSGVRVSDGYRVLCKEVGGPSQVGFTSQDVYNRMEIEKKKTIDGCDANTLFEILKKRSCDEQDFYFNFELDSDSSLCNLFWRDGQMKADYKIFEDLVVHDTTYRTNKYGLICGPFVGMDNPCRNVMFEIGFIKNEKIELEYDEQF